MEISNKEIGLALADTSDADFAEVMLAFAQSVDDDKIKRIGQVMSPSLGANRKQVWRKIMEWVTYFEKDEKQQ